MLQTSHLQELKQRYASMYIQQEDTEEVEVAEGIRDFKVGDTVKFVNDDSDYWGQTGKITSLSGNGISQKATVKLDKGGKSVTNVLVKVDLIKEEVAEGWKKGKYTIKDENGKILGTYSSGGKAKKVMDDLMQKGDYPELTVSMVEEVEIDESFIDDIVDTFKSILRIPKNVALITKSILNGNVKDMESLSSNLSDKQRDKMIKMFSDQLKDGKYKKQGKINIIKLLATLKHDSLKEEVEVAESIHDKKSTFTMAPFEDLRGVADVALKIMQRQPQEVKEEEQEVTSEETPQKLTEYIV